MSLPRPAPRLNAVNRPFWTGGAEGKLNIQQCGDCGQFTHPPLPLCRHCQSERIGHKAVPGTGTIDTLTVNHQAWAPGLEVPLVIALVALDEAPGVYVTTNIVGSPVDAVQAGDRVAVTFEQQGELHFPLFKKVD
jgi:uncharacterized protein